MKQRIVMKFGGTSVGNASAIRRVVDIINHHQTTNYEILVVVSAAAGITDALNHAVELALLNKTESFKTTLTDIYKIYQEIANDLLENHNFRNLFLKILEDNIEESNKSWNQLAHDHSNLPRLKDKILSFGERIQVHLIASALQQLGIQSSPVSATELIITDDHFQEATPQQPITNTKLQGRLNPLLQMGIIPVITGFIGATAEGDVTTLGRGGSDYTAAIVAAGINADEVWIWTDVDGIMTTDPNLVDGARSITEISYLEAYDLAFFGARVLHPKTILPLEIKEIPIRIKNTFTPEKLGTHIHISKNQSSMIKAVTGIKQVSIVAIRKRGYEDFSSLLNFVKEALGKIQLEALGVYQDQNKDSAFVALKGSISNEQLSRMEQELANLIPGRHFKRIHISPPQTLIAAVGHHIQSNPLISSKIKLILAQGGVTIWADAYRNTDHSLSFLIADHDHLKAINQIHQEVLSYA